jgi:hypothetical protein
MCVVCWDLILREPRFMIFGCNQNFYTGLRDFWVEARSYDPGQMSLVCCGRVGAKQQVRFAQKRSSF